MLRQVESRRLKHVVELKRIRASDDVEGPYVGLEDIESWTGQLAAEPEPLTQAEDSVESGSGHSQSNSFQPEDVLFGKLRPYLAKAWVADFAGRCTTEALVMRALDVEPRFLLYVLLQPSFIDAVNSSTYGSKMPRAEWDFIGSVRVPVPPRKVQRAVADFLDRATARLDALLAAKQRVLDLLAEKRKAIIATAVTRGLDPKVKLRDSGVPWLGEIPSHWRSTRVGRLFRQSKMLGFPDLTVLSVYREFGVIERASRDDNANRVPDDLSKYQLVEVGDLVINKMKAWQGSLGVSDFRGITSPDYVVFRPIHSEDPRFLHSMLRMPQLTTVYLSISNGIRINQWRIEPERFASVEVFLPSLEEQRAIVDHIARETAKLDAVRAATERTIALLKERRSALIAAAVTGQIDLTTEEGAAA